MTRQRARKVTDCQYCQHFHAIGVRCEVCKSAPKTGVTVDKARNRPKTRKSQSTRQKRLSLTQRLTVAGLTSDAAIRDAIATGELVTALYHTTGDTGEAVLAEYMGLVERVGTESQVLTFRNRLVSYRENAA